MFDLEYLTDATGQPTAVVIPIDLWRKLFPGLTTQPTPEDFTDAIEDYCLHQAMIEAETTPLLDREAALAYLEALSE